MNDDAYDDDAYRRLMRGLFVVALLPFTGPWALVAGAAGMIYDAAEEPNPCGLGHAMLWSLEAFAAPVRWSKRLIPKRKPRVMCGLLGEESTP